MYTGGEAIHDAEILPVMEQFDGSTLCTTGPNPGMVSVSPLFIRLTVGVAGVAVLIAYNYTVPSGDHDFSPDRQCKVEQTQPNQTRQRKTQSAQVPFPCPRDIPQANALHAGRSRKKLRQRATTLQVLFVRFAISRA